MCAAHAQRGGTHRELFDHATRFHEQRLQIILCDLHTGTRGTGHLSLCIFAADSSGNGIQKLLRTSDSAASIQDSCARVASMICCAVLSPELSPAVPAFNSGILRKGRNHQGVRHKVFAWCECLRVGVL